MARSPIRGVSQQRGDLGVRLLVPGAGWAHSILAGADPSMGQDGGPRRRWMLSSGLGTPSRDKEANSERNFVELLKSGD